MKALFGTSIFLLLWFVTFLPEARGEKKDPIQVGWIGPLTGAAAALGVDSVPAIQIAFDHVNQAGGILGRPLELLVEDDQYETAKTILAYQKLVSQSRIQFIFVVTYGGLFAIAQNAQREGVLLFDPLDCDDAIAALPENTFCVAKKTEALGFQNAELAVQEGDVPGGMLYFDGDPFMVTVAKASLSKFDQLGTPAAYAEGYHPGTTDFKPMLLRAKAKGAKSIFFFGYDEMGLAMKQARELNLTAPFYSMNTIMSPGFRESAGPAAEGAYVVSWLAPDTPALKSFLLEFKKRVGRAPYLDISTIPSFDIATLLGDAMRTAARDEKVEIDPAKIRNFFYAVANYQGVSGTITIDRDGITRSLKNRLFRFRGGKLEPM